MIVNIIENLMIIVIIVDMGVKGIVKVLKGSGEYMTENFRIKYLNSTIIHNILYSLIMGICYVLEKTSRTIFLLVQDY